MLFDVQGLVRLTMLVRREERYPGWLFPRDVGEWKLVKGKSSPSGGHMMQGGFPPSQGLGAREYTTRSRLTTACSAVRRYSSRVAPPQYRMT